MSEEYSFDFDENDITNMLQNMGNDLRKDTKSALKEIGGIVKNNVESALPRSKTNPKGRPHMKDDVKTQVKTFATTGGYVKVQGGPLTRSLWHLVNNGHPDRYGHFIQGNHFIDKASAASDSQVNSIVDGMISEAVNADG